MDQLIKALEESIEDLEPISDEEADELYEDVNDRCGGNVDDALAMGVDLGERQIANVIRRIITEHKERQV